MDDHILLWPRSILLAAPATLPTIARVIQFFIVQTLPAISMSLCGVGGDGEAKKEWWGLGMAPAVPCSRSKGNKHRKLAGRCASYSPPVRPVSVALPCLQVALNFFFFLQEFIIVI